MSAWVELAVGAGAATVGALVGFGGSLIVSRRERDAATEAERLRAAAADQAERRRAIAAYLGALYPIVSELRALPNPPEEETALRDDLLGQLLGALPEPYTDLGAKLVALFDSEAARHMRAHRAVGDRPYETGAALAAAYAQLQVLALDPAVRKVLSDANQYVIALGAKRTPELIEAWHALHGRLEGAIDLL